MKTMNQDVARIENMTVETTPFTRKEVKDARLSRYLASVESTVDMVRVISASSILHLTAKDASIMYAMASMAENEQLDFFKIQRATQKSIMSNSSVTLENGTKIYKRGALVTTADVLRAVMILNAFDSRYHIQLCADGSTKILSDSKKKSLLRSSFYLTGDADANGKKIRRTVTFNDTFRNLFLEALKQCDGKYDILSLLLSTKLTAIDVEKMEDIASIDKKKDAEKKERVQEARAEKKAANA